MCFEFCDTICLSGDGRIFLLDRFVFLLDDLLLMRNNLPQVLFVSQHLLHFLLMSSDESILLLGEGKRLLYVKVIGRHVLLFGFRCFRLFAFGDTEFHFVALTADEFVVLGHARHVVHAVLFTEVNADRFEEFGGVNVVVITGFVDGEGIVGRFLEYTEPEDTFGLCIIGDTEMCSLMDV